MIVKKKIEIVTFIIFAGKSRDLVTGWRAWRLKGLNQLVPWSWQHVISVGPMPVALRMAVSDMTTGHVCLATGFRSPHMMHCNCLMWILDYHIQGTLFWWNKWTNEMITNNNANPTAYPRKQNLKIIIKYLNIINFLIIIIIIC